MLLSSFAFSTTSPASLTLASMVVTMPISLSLIHISRRPSCSNYTMQAIMTHGCVKGILLGAWRIARCNPFGKWGFDPVPEPGRWQNPACRLQPAKLFSTRHKQKVEK